MSDNNGTEYMPSRKYREYRGERTGGRPRKGKQHRSNGRPPGGKNHEGHSAGAPDGNQNALSHGLVAFRNRAHRRTRKGRSLIDRRSAAGKNAVAIGDQLLVDMGGEANCSTAKLMLIEMVRRDVYFLDETARRIFKAIYKLSAQEKALEILGKTKNPKLIATLYSYRQTAANNLARNLLALGLEKLPPKQKTLEEILAEPEESDQGNTRDQS